MSASPEHLGVLEYFQAPGGSWHSHRLLPPATTHLASGRPRPCLPQLFGSNCPVVRASGLLFWEVSFSGWVPGEGAEPCLVGGEDRGWGGEEGAGGAAWGKLGECCVVFFK